MITESLTIGIFAALVWLGLPLMGVRATGLAFLGMYIVYLPVIHWIARRKTGFRWTSRIKRQLVRLALTALAVCLLGNLSNWYALGVGLPATLLFEVYGLCRLSHVVKLSGLAERLADTSKVFLTKIGMWHE